MCPNSLSLPQLHQTTHHLTHPPHPPLVELRPTHLLLLTYILSRPPCFGICLPLLTHHNPITKLLPLLLTVLYSTHLIRRLLAYQSSSTPLLLPSTQSSCLLSAGSLVHRPGLSFASSLTFIDSSVSRTIFTSTNLSLFDNACSSYRQPRVGPCSPFRHPNRSKSLGSNSHSSANQDSGRHPQAKRCFGRKQAGEMGRRCY